MELGNIVEFREPLKHCLTPVGGRVSALLPRLSWQVSGFVLFRLPQFRLYRGDSGVGFTRVVVARVD